MHDCIYSVFRNTLMFFVFFSLKVSFHDYNQDGQLALDLIVRHFKIRCAELDLLNKGKDTSFEEHFNLIRVYIM